VLPILEAIVGALVSAFRSRASLVAENLVLRQQLGDFYLFTAPGGSSIVTRFRPSDGSLVQVATLSQTIVGAGVSTCAP
jgi:hypothetical protein